MDEPYEMKTLVIAVFDDMDFPPALRSILSDVKSECSIYVGNQYASSGYSRVEIKFHKVETNEDYRRYAETCKGGLEGIAIFDLLFENIDHDTSECYVDFLQQTYPSRFEQVCIQELGNEWKIGLLENAGMILACLSATSKSNKADIYLGSSNSELRAECSSLLMNMLSRRQGSHDLEIGILNLSTKILLVGKLKTLIDQYFKNRTVNDHSLEELFWPSDSGDWFLKLKDLADGDVPHNFSDFCNLYASDEAKLKSLLGQYLSTIVKCHRTALAPNSVEELVLDLLRIGEFYEVLKSFLGKGSLLGSGRERPNASAFILPLLAALGANTVVKNLLGGGLKRRVCFADRVREGGRISFHPTDRTNTRKLFVKCALLFSAMHSEGSEIVDVTCQSRDDLDFLIFQWNIDPVVRSSKNGGTRGARHPLLTLTQFRADEKCDGTMSVVNAFQDACKPASPNDDRCIYTWFLPGKESGTIELRVGVADRG